MEHVVVHVGVDIGQKQDPTAIVAVQIQNREDGYHYIARHVERLRLGTPYPDVARRLLQIHNRLKEHGAEVIRYWVDATGVGQPVVDLLPKAGLSGLTAVYLNATDRAVRESWSELRLGKALLVSRLQVLLQSGNVHLSQNAEAQALVDELLNYEIRVSENATDSYGVFSTGKHDDLATALGLACLEDPSFPRIVWLGDDLSCESTFSTWKGPGSRWRLS
jgi:hypothetical protein